MPRYHVGHRTDRWKWNLIFFLGIFLIFAVTCVSLYRYDWSRISREQTSRRFLEAEATIARQKVPEPEKIRQLMASSNLLLRDRYLAGYFYCPGQNIKSAFIGRPDAKFRIAIEAQKAAIDAGMPFDEKKIPKYRLTIEFPITKCRLILAEKDDPLRP